MVTVSDVNVMLWQQLNALAVAGTIQIAGKVYNGERDLKHVSEDITVRTTLVTGSEHVQRADVNVNVFANDIAVGGNVYVPDDDRLAVLSSAVAAFVDTIDYVIPNVSVSVIDVTETRLDEPALRQHYNNFLIRMSIYD